MVIAGARGCLGELPGSRVEAELVTNMERTLLADSRVARALWIRLNLCVCVGATKALLSIMLYNVPSQIQAKPHL